MNEPIRLQLEIVIPPEAIRQIAKLLAPPATPDQKRLENSRRAIFAGQKPPEDEALLLNTKEVLRLRHGSTRDVLLRRNGNGQSSIGLSITNGHPTGK